jgi:N-acetylglucosaminyl-diphospho-decaprenol L-rhamnosyltransferase
MTRADASVAVVTYASAGEIEACLASIEAAGAAAIVVDNASPDGTADLVRARFPHVELIANDENRGFGSAVNQAAERVTTRYLGVLNPDARLGDGALDTLVRYLDEHEDVAVASPVLRDDDDGRQRTAALEPRLVDLACVAVPPLGAFVRSYRNGGYEPTLYERGEPFEAESVIGACMILRTDAFHEVGGFDEGFFLYMEEIDLCARLRARPEPPNRVVVVPAAAAYHRGGASAAAPSMRERARYEQTRSQLLYFRKHRSPAWQAAARALGLVTVGRLAAQAGVRIVREPAHRPKWAARLRQAPALAGLYLGIERSTR